MTGSPHSNNLEELLAGYVLGDLDSEELAWLKQQLETHPELKVQIRELQEILALLPHTLPSETPASALRGRILQEAGEPTSTEEVPSPKPQGFSRLSRIGWVFGSLAALLAIALGLDGLRLRQELATAQDRLQQQQGQKALLRQPDNRLLALKGVNSVPTASGSLVISPERHKAVLTLKNLAPLTGEQVYRLWAVSNGQKKGCIDFLPNAEGTVHVEITPETLKTATSVLVTIEPHPGTVQPQGSMVMSGYQSL